MNRLPIVTVTLIFLVACILSSCGSAGGCGPWSSDQHLPNAIVIHAYRASTYELLPKSFYTTVEMISPKYEDVTYKWKSQTLHYHNSNESFDNQSSDEYAFGISPRTESMTFVFSSPQRRDTVNVSYRMLQSFDYCREEPALIAGNLSIKPAVRDSVFFKIAQAYKP